MWIYEPAVRAGELIEVMIEEIIASKIDAKADTAVVEYVEALVQEQVFDKLKGDIIIDGTFSLDRTLTTSDEISQGRFHFKSQFGVYVPFEQAFVEIKITTDYQAQVVASING